MSNSKYRYNPKTLSYEEVKVTFGRRVLKALLWLAPSLLVGLLLTVFFVGRIDSPKALRLQSELDKSSAELKRLQESMKLCNEVLDIIEDRDEDLYRATLYADEFPEELRRMGTGGSEKYAYLKGMSTSEMLIETSTQMDQLKKRLHAQSMSFRELLDLAKDKEKMVSSIPSIQPVRNSDLKRAISGFGWRIDPIYRTRRMHTGMDFTADKGTDVYATGDGVVEAIENKRWGYGKSIIINHGFGYKTRYAHLSAIKTTVGATIKRGDLIGLVGSTGKSTGPHLHYEVIRNGEKVNPIGYYHSDLSPEQYEQLLEASKHSHKALD